MAAGTTFSLFSILPYCYFATKISYRFQANGLRIYQCMWYKMKMSQQRNLQFMIAYAQTVRHFKGFGILDCTLEMFMKVFSKCYNYDCLHIISVLFYFRS